MKWFEDIEHMVTEVVYAVNPLSLPWHIRRFTICLQKTTFLNPVRDLSILASFCWLVQHYHMKYPFLLGNKL